MQIFLHFVHSEKETKIVFFMVKNLSKGSIFLSTIAIRIGTCVHFCSLNDSLSLQTDWLWTYLDIIFLLCNRSFSNVKKFKLNSYGSIKYNSSLQQYLSNTNKSPRNIVAKKPLDGATLLWKLPNVTSKPYK